MSNIIHNVPKIQPVTLQLDAQRSPVLTQERHAKITHISFCLGAVITTAGIVAFVASFLFASLAVATIFITIAQLIAVSCLVVGSAALTASLAAKIFRAFENFAESIIRKKQLLLWQKQLNLTQNQLNQLKINFNQGRSLRLRVDSLIDSRYQTFFRSAILQRNLNIQNRIQEARNQVIPREALEPVILRNTDPVPPVEILVPADVENERAEEVITVPAAAPKKGPFMPGLPASGKKVPLSAFKKGTAKKGPPPPVPKTPKGNVGAAPAKATGMLNGILTFVGLGSGNG